MKPACVCNSNHWVSFVISINSQSAGHLYTKIVLVFFPKRDGMM